MRIGRLENLWEFLFSKNLKPLKVIKIIEEKTFMKTLKVL
jgi:hypothetical protein